MLNGVPSITWGVVVYGLVVLRFKGFSAYAGGLALGLMMIPLIMRTTEEVVLLVPNGYREAALALGRQPLENNRPHRDEDRVERDHHWDSARARSRGRRNRAAPFHRFRQSLLEPQPSEPIAALPLQIFTYAISPYDDWHRQAWAGALVLVTGIFCVNVLVRILTRGRARVSRISDLEMTNIVMATPERSVMERVEQTARAAARPPEAAPARTFEVKNLSIWYGEKRAIKM